MRWLLAPLAWLAVTHGVQAQQQPYIPSRDDIVLQTVPSVADPRVRAIEGLRVELGRRPRDVLRAVRLAEAYVDFARDTADARYLGRAEAVIAPWLKLSTAPLPVLLAHAVILQSRHDFAQAREQLRHILRRDPDNAQAWLTLATVDQVQGQLRSARRDCAHLLDSSDPVLPAACLSALNAVDGHAQNAYRTLSQLWPQARAETAPIQSWIQGLLADAAKYLGDASAADVHFREALQLAPGNNFLLADYADFLLDQGQPRAALELVKSYPQSDTSFLRQVYAEARLGAARTQADADEMARRFTALEMRGSHTYQREQAGFVLYIVHDPIRALHLARENWALQRAPEDMRILLEAALAAGKPAAAQPVLEQLEVSHLQDPIVRSLANRARGAP
jgi:Tfp pilus assembly protein PilF